MTSAATDPNIPVTPDGDNVSARPSRSWIRRVLGETFVKTGAKVGLAWLAVVSFFAVFAPFVANSRPLWMVDGDGNASSPLILNLTAADVTLLGAAVVGVVVFVARKRIGKRPLLVWLSASAAIWLVAIVLVNPSDLGFYAKHRELQASGEIHSVVRTIIPYSPNDRLDDQSGIIPPAPPDAEHWLGLDANKADVASRMIHACRVALTIGFLATGIAVTLGVIIGGLMGFFSGVVDLIGMRLVEIIEAVPTLFLLLIFVAFFPGDNPEVLPGISIPRIYFIMAIIGLTSWSGYARFVRAEFLKLRKQDFVQAAIACGLPLRSILFRHMLPNGVAPVLVSASFGVASAILAEAVLSFLGLGLNEDPSWGEMLRQATGAAGTFSWWLAIFPGAAIFLTVFAYTLIGEALRDAIDPHLKKSAHL